MKYPKYLLDTSFILALLFEKDFYHEDAKRIYKHLPDDAILITHFLVVQETFSVACRRCKEKKLDCNFVLSKIQEFFERIEITSKDYSFQSVSEKMKEFHCNLSFVDTVITLEAKRLKASLLTFDKKLQNTIREFLSS